MHWADLTCFSENHGEGLAFPCHVTAKAHGGLFITNLTPHDGYILLSLIVMKCKLSSEVGDN